MQPDPDSPIETPVEDATEQATDANPVEAAAEADYKQDVHRGMEVGEWDATEQARPVPLPDEDYD